MNSIWRNLRYDLPLHFILLLTNWLPDNVLFLRLRGILCSPFLGSCGGKFKIGRNVTLYNPVNIYIGRDVYIAFGCVLLAIDMITLGEEVMLGPYCVLASNDHSRAGKSFRHGPNRQAPIQIGSGSWLGAHVVVTAGSTIGEGTLIAAGAVVTNSIPAHVVAGGLPAHTIKELE